MLLHVQFVFNLFTDLSLFLQPIPSMWKLQMLLAKRLGLMACYHLACCRLDVYIQPHHEQ